MEPLPTILTESRSRLGTLACDMPLGAPLSGMLGTREAGDYDRSLECSTSAKGASSFASSPPELEAWQS